MFCIIKEILNKYKINKKYNDYNHIVKKYYNTYYLSENYTTLKKEEILIIRNINIFLLRNLINNMSIFIADCNEYYTVKDILYKNFNYIDLLINLYLKTNKVLINNQNFNYKNYYLNKLKQDKFIKKDSFLIEELKILLKENNSNKITYTKFYINLIKNYIDKYLYYYINYCSEYESENILIDNRRLNLLLFKDLYLEQLLEEIKTNVYQDLNNILLIIFLINHYVIKLHYKNNNEIGIIKFNVSKLYQKDIAIKTFLKRLEIFSKF